MKNISNSSLVEKLKNLVGEERKITALILEYLNEVDSRKLYLEFGYPSLFEFCVKELRYSESSAFRRISSMRLLKNLPEVKEKIISGNLSLSVVTQAQSFFKKQERISRPVSKESKLDLLRSLENKSSRACERVLLELCPETVSEDKVRAVTPEFTELRLTVDQEFMSKIEKLRNLLSHSHPNLSVQEILEQALDQLLLRKDPLGKVQIVKGPVSKNLTRSLPTSVLPRNKASRYIPAEIRRTVWFQSDSKCSYKSPITGKTCGSPKFLEIDHKIPLSKGGRTQTENLQLLCDQHNRQKGDQV